jgi:hypothetical protein
MKADRQATAARHFKDPGSFVFKDGRERLAGKDWEARKLELWERCRGFCEWQNEYQAWACAHPAADPHHKIRRSVSRDDRLDNLLALCRFHHNLLDERKPRWTKRSPAELMR